MFGVTSTNTGYGSGSNYTANHWSSQISTTYSDYSSYQNGSEQFYGLSIDDNSELINGAPNGMEYTEPKFEPNLTSSCAFSTPYSEQSLISPTEDAGYHPFIGSISDPNGFSASCASDETSCSSPPSDFGWSEYFNTPQSSAPYPTSNMHAQQSPVSSYHQLSSHSSAVPHNPSASHPHAPQQTSPLSASIGSGPSCELFASEALKAQAAQLNQPPELPRTGWTKVQTSSVSKGYVLSKESLKTFTAPALKSSIQPTNHDRIIGEALVKSESSPGDDEERKRRRRERNKVAATKCRHKKKAHVLKLGVESELLTSSNEELRRELLELQKESERLAELLSSHQNYCKRPDLSPMIEGNPVGFG